MIGHSGSRARTLLLLSPPQDPSMGVIRRALTKNLARMGFNTWDIHLNLPLQAVWTALEGEDFDDQLSCPDSMKLKIATGPCPGCQGDNTCAEYYVATNFDWQGWAFWCNDCGHTWTSHTQVPKEVTVKDPTEVLFVTLEVTVCNREWLYMGKSGGSKLKFQVPRAVLNAINPTDLVIGVLQAAITNYDTSEGPGPNPESDSEPEGD